MITNTYAPHVGGVARSVQRFTDEYRKLGHNVTVVASGDPQKTDRGVLRVPSIPDVGGSSFSFPIITKNIEESLIIHNLFPVYRPDVIHSHHPFLLGNTARRLSNYFKVPLIFTHHTMYEQYSYVAGSIGKHYPMFFADLATEYANSCDTVIAPSKSTKEILLERGVKAPIKVCPTGLSLHKFASGNGEKLRKQLNIDPSSPVIGYVGRLAPEKNLEFLGNVAKGWIKNSQKRHFIIVGDGPYTPELRKQLSGNKQCHFTGSLNGQDLIDAYHAMDLFVFSSQSETQGMVLVEAMAAGLPVVACMATGVKDVVTNHWNGLLVKEDLNEFISSIDWSLKNRDQLSLNAIESSKSYSQDLVARRAINLYQESKFSNKVVLTFSRLATRMTS